MNFVNCEDTAKIKVKSKKFKVKKTEDRRRKTEDRRRKTEDRRPKTEDRRRKTEDGRPKTKDESKQFKPKCIWQKSNIPPNRHHKCRLATNSKLRTQKIKMKTIYFCL